MKQFLRYAAPGQKGMKQKELAEIYDVSPSLISKVVNGHIWGHVNDEA